MCSVIRVSMETFGFCGRGVIVLVHAHLPFPCTHQWPPRYWSTIMNGRHGDKHCFNMAVYECLSSWYCLYHLSKTPRVTGVCVCAYLDSTGVRECEGVCGCVCEGVCEGVCEYMGMGRYVPVSVCLCVKFVLWLVCLWFVLLCGLSCFTGI